MRKINIPLKTGPRNYQVEAFNFCRDHDHSALLMEQRTGKTSVAIAVAGKRYLNNQIEKLLIVAPLTVVPVWHKELLKHADYPYRLRDLTKVKDKKLALTFNTPDRLDIAIVNYESVWRYIKLIKKWSPDMIIADESQEIKNGRAKQSRALHRLSDISSYRMILTGTMIVKNPLDVWSQYRFLDYNIFGKRFKPFRERYCIMGGYMNYKIKGYKHLDELSEKVLSIAFRVTQDEVLNIPDPSIKTFNVVMSNKSRAIYDEMEKEFLVQFDNGKLCTAPLVITQILRLQQITGGFLPTEDGSIESVGSSKLTRVKSLLSGSLRNKKVIIFARFIPEIKAIESISKKLDREPVLLYGKVKKRSKVIKEFQENESVKDIIVQIQTGGLGIDLSSADAVIFFSMTHSYGDYDQARCRSINEDKSTKYIYIVADDTVDEDVLSIVKVKGSLAKEVVDRIRARSSKK